MKKTALVIMAAGIGSRFGGGIKQLEPVGPSGEIIMDYSIHDALEAGFDKIIFIIRKDLEKDFREIIGNRIEKIAHVEYAFQEMDDLPEGFSVPEGRKKPWGTGQAVLAARDLIHEPFLVINADDYYGKEGFRKIHDYMVNEMKEDGDVYDMCMAGFILSPLNTLSDSHPASTVPTTPRAAENAMICVAFSREKSLAFCRKRTPHPAMAYFSMYMKALDAAMIHIPGCLRTYFWTFAVGMVSSFRSCSPDSSCTDGSPLLSGVSLMNVSMMAAPANPPADAKTNPYCHPNADTTRPTIMKERNSPR